MQLTYRLDFIEKYECDVTSDSISLVSHTLIILSSLRPVMKNCESSVIARALTGFLCSYRVVMSLPLGLHAGKRLFK